MLASMAGGFVGAAVVSAIAIDAGRIIGFAAAEGVRWAMAGAVIGVMQWLVLRQHIPQAGWWVLATTAGWAMGGVVSWAMGFAAAGPMVRTVDQVIFGAVTGAVVGAMQWGILRRHVPQAGWWVLASAAGSAVGGLVSWAVTGIALVWLLRQPRQV